MPLTDLSTAGRMQIPGAPRRRPRGRTAGRVRARALVLGVGRGRCPPPDPTWSSGLGSAPAQPQRCRRGGPNGQKLVEAPQRTMVERLDCAFRPSQHQRGLGDGQARKVAQGDHLLLIGAQAGDRVPQLKRSHTARAISVPCSGDQSPGASSETIGWRWRRPE